MIVKTRKEIDMTKQKRDTYEETLKRNIEICRICASSTFLDPSIVEKATNEKYRLEFMLMQYNRLKEMDNK